MSKYFFVLILFAFVIFSCKNEEVYTPKPRTYPRIEFPERNYLEFDHTGCPFNMPQPDYFNFQKDSLNNKDSAASDCWFELYSPTLNTYIYFSYLNINDRIHFDKLVDDAFTLADKHNVKADYRDEILISQPEKNVSGVLFEISGPVATPLQFYLTDSTQHFLRGSLYFKSKVNRDSIAPVYDFVREDIDSLIRGFRWK